MKHSRQAHKGVLLSWPLVWFLVGQSFRKWLSYPCSCFFDHVLAFEPNYTFVVQAWFLWTNLLPPLLGIPSCIHDHLNGTIPKISPKLFRVGVLKAIVKNNFDTTFLKNMKNSQKKVNYLFTFTIKIF